MFELACMLLRMALVGWLCLLLYHVHSVLCVHLVELIVINFALVDVDY